MMPDDPRFAYLRAALKNCLHGRCREDNARDALRLLEDLRAGRPVDLETMPYACTRCEGLNAAGDLSCKTCHAPRGV